MRKNRSLRIALFASLALAMVVSLSPRANAADDEKSGDRGESRNKEEKILEFDTMIGVPRPYTGAINAIRGVSGGGLPWVVSSAKGELRQDGQLRIKVSGLVFDPNDPTVIERGLANQNTVASLGAIVSCLSKDLSGAPTTVNVMTGLFAATTGFASQGGGDVKIEANLDLPKPCIAPIVFVTSPGGSWFATTGK